MRTCCTSLSQIDNRVSKDIHNQLIVTRYLPITILLDNENENVISFPLILPSSSSIDRVDASRRILHTLIRKKLGSPAQIFLLSVNRAKILTISVSS